LAAFNEHLSGAAVSAGLLSSTLMITDLFTPSQIAILWIVGTLGGLGPDVDSDSSITLKSLFSGLGILTSFSILFIFKSLPLLHLWSLMLSGFILVRYISINLFVKFTSHRGSMHSVLAAVLMGLLSVYISINAFKLSNDFSWAIGISVFTGYMTHLVLDEMFAVNLAGAEFKKSFGTALKLFSLKKIYITLTYFAISGFLFTTLPRPEKLTAAIFNKRTSQYVVDSLDILKNKNNEVIDGLKDKVSKL
jgi:hypothetical protein